MGPPRERGGEPRLRPDEAVTPAASMGPPRERGGEQHARARCGAFARLQWGHRANAVESWKAARMAVKRAAASMGPPRERGGEHTHALVTGDRDNMLQWGHRAN